MALWHCVEGRLLGMIDTPDLAAAHVWAASRLGGVVLDAESWLLPATHYEHGGALLERPPLPDLPSLVAVGFALTVAGVPDGAAVRVEDDDGDTVGAGVIAGGAVPILFTAPGRYVLHIGDDDTAFPYQPGRWEIEVVDP